MSAPGKAYSCSGGSSSGGNSYNISISVYSNGNHTHTLHTHTLTLSSQKTNLGNVGSARTSSSIIPKSLAKRNMYGLG